MEQTVTCTYSPVKEPSVNLLFLPIGTVLRGRYIIQNIIANGGFGITYKAYDQTFDREVAIKEFFMKSLCYRKNITEMGYSDSSITKDTINAYKSKFIKEASVLSQFKSCSGIVNVSDVFQENNTAYYSMDFIKGESIEHYVKTNGKLTENDSKSIIVEVANILKYVHNHNYLHLDITPRNIMRKDNGQLVLIDFGVSKHYDDKSGKQTTTTDVARSAGYAPLEQYQNDVQYFSPSTDIYALGGVFYFLLTGKRPPEASVDFELEWDIYVSDPIQEIVEKMMSPGAKSRPQSIEELLGLLDSTDIQGSEKFVFQGKIDYDQNNEIIKVKWLLILLLVLLFVFIIFTTIS